MYDPLQPNSFKPHRDLAPPAPAATPTPKQHNKRLTWALEGGILLFGVLLALLLRWGVYETAIVTSGSMEPTFQVGDRVLVDHRASLRGKWQRGDVVFFQAPEAWGGDDLLTKRVIGLPGESVELRDGVVFINGRKLNETYLKEPPLPENGGPTTIPAGEYWAMGDNRNISEDSRAHGTVPDSDIKGREARVLWPLGDAGSFARPDYGF